MVFPDFSQIWTFTVAQFTFITWADIVDILLVAALFFAVYRFISERPATRYVLGVLAVLLLTALAFVFDFHSLRFIMRGILDVGVIALIVLFQPEIRSALEKIGEGSARRFKGRGDSHLLANRAEMVDSLCEAVTDLSRTKTGALIVMERSTKLGDIIRSGVELDSKINPYIIRNIFYNKAPLHDGAVIIRGNRICAASCFLPLTERAINQDLGTRHRAALGMSEISDALVIVVSEETGMISLAFDGELKCNQNYQTLKQTLFDLCSRR